MASYRLFSLFAILQASAAMFGFLAALVDIEAIVFAGPILTLTGLFIAFVAFLRKHRLGVLYGLGVPELSVLCFATIALNRWSPQQAYYPINLMIAVFVLVNAPACALVVRDAQQRLSRPTEKIHYQFSIAGIMSFTAVVAAMLGLQRMLGFSSLTFAVLLWHLFVIGWYWWTQPPRRAEQRPMMQPAPELDVKQT